MLIDSREAQYVYMPIAYLFSSVDEIRSLARVGLTAGGCLVGLTTGGCLVLPTYCTLLINIIHLQTLESRSQMKHEMRVSSTNSETIIVCELIRISYNCLPIEIVRLSKHYELWVLPHLSFACG